MATEGMEVRGEDPTCSTHGPLPTGATAPAHPEPHTDKNMNITITMKSHVRINHCNDGDACHSRAKPDVAANERIMRSNNIKDNQKHIHNATKAKTTQKLRRTERKIWVAPREKRLWEWRWHRRWRHWTKKTTTETTAVTITRRCEVDNNAYALVDDIYAERTTYTVLYGSHEYWRQWRIGNVCRMTTARATIKTFTSKLMLSTTTALYRLNVKFIT